MQQAPSLAEAPPSNGESRNGSNLPASPDSRSTPGSLDHRTRSASPPVRKDTISSTSTTVTDSSVATITSNETAATALSSVESPTHNYNGHAVFSVKDAEEVPTRRPSRRRTGPLSAQQRERAALIRKLRACPDCRRRRVACDPRHHGISWDEAVAKFKSISPTMPHLAPVSPSGRRLSPSAPLLGSGPSVYHDPHDMEVDSTPAHQPGRPPLSETRLRTPLPSGPRPDKTTPYTPLAGLDSPKGGELQGLASRILADPYRGRYRTVQVLLLYWQDDDDAQGVKAAVDQLSNILSGHYNYTLEVKLIPSPSESCKSSWKWLSSTITSFVEHRDQRDDLKIVYYNGHSYLDADRQMVLASSKAADAATARWSGLQQILEEASSDILLLMDAAYYPSSTLQRKQGVFELLAASISEDASKNIGRNKFTRALSDLLYSRTSQKSFEHVSAAEIHAKLLSAHYPKMIQDRYPEQEVITSFPSPLHLQISGDTRLPSISLAPIPKSAPYASDSALNGTGAYTQLTLTFRLSDDDINMEKWSEWLQMMPDGIKDVKVEGPYRNTFR